jgi:hypothetical protein
VLQTPLQTPQFLGVIEPRLGGKLHILEAVGMQPAEDSPSAWSNGTGDWLQPFGNSLGDFLGGILACGAILRHHGFNDLANTVFFGNDAWPPRAFGTLNVA